MIGIGLGVVVILMGAKGFTEKGLPLTSSKDLTGRPAKIIGVCCILFGVLLVAEGTWSTLRMIKSAQAQRQQ